MAYYGTTTSMTFKLTLGTEATLELCDNDIYMYKCTYVHMKYMNALYCVYVLVYFPYSITRKTTLHAIKQHVMSLFPAKSKWLCHCHHYIELDNLTHLYINILAYLG